MSQYRVRLGLTITPTDDRDDIDAFTDNFMEHLVDCNDDADLIGSLTDGTFQVWVTVEAADPVSAVVDGTSIIRAAAHAAGGHTPSWPNADEWPAWMHTESVEATPVDQPVFV